MATNTTIGHVRVRSGFNPSEREVVKQMKARTALLIDTLEALKTEDGHDPRLISIAQTKYEEAVMWAVKAATANT